MKLSLSLPPSFPVPLKTYLLEKTRVASHPEGEGNFNIFYQLIAGADDQLTAELMLDALPGEEPNLYVEPHDNVSTITSHLQHVHRCMLRMLHHSYIIYTRHVITVHLSQFWLHNIHAYFSMK